MQDSGPPSLRDLHPAAWKTLRDAARVTRVPTGALLIREGDHSDHIVLVETGALKLYASIENGDVVVLALRFGGDVIGLSSALDGRPRPATVVALQPSAVAIVTATRLRATLRAHPDVTLALLREAALRVHEADRRRVDLCTHDAAGRVHRVLAELVHRFGGQPQADSRQVPIPLVQQDIASLAGVSREATTKALRHLRAYGVIATSRCQITVLRPEALTTLATAS